MKCSNSHPMILKFPSADPSPTTIPLRGKPQRAVGQNRLRRDLREALASSDGTLSPMRTRLLRMIIENERVRNDGPRAS